MSMKFSNTKIYIFQNFTKTVKKNICKIQWNMLKYYLYPYIYIYFFLTIGELQPSGQYLTLTEDMIGANSWTCSATNTIDGATLGTTATLDFIVGKYLFIH